ncbi:shikimate dehydrogenase family protein [Agromyces bauzanensis]
MTAVFSFFGVTTGQSAIQRIYPRWVELLALDARLVGLDFPVGAPAGDYRRAVERIKADPNALGGLITTHKLNVLAASADLFDGLDDSAALLREVSCIHKRDGRLLGAALDDRTSRLAIDRFAPPSYWAEHGGELLLLGAGGASIATTHGMHRAAELGEAVPSRIHVTARSEHRLEELRSLHDRIGMRIEVVVHHVTSTPEEADRVVAGVAPRSVVVNATGLGKDRPGSPLTDAVRFPPGSIAWDMNYRGERRFLEQARNQPADAAVAVIDGWDYFVYSWTQVLGVVHDLDIPSSGALFDELSQIAHDEMSA